MIYNSELPLPRRAFAAAVIGKLQSDPRQKILWLEKAAEQGVPECIEALKKL